MRHLRLPKMDSYPVAEGVPDNATELEKANKLLPIFRGFVLEIVRGTILTQFTSEHGRRSFHCQLSEDMHTFKVREK